MGEVVWTAYWDCDKCFEPNILGDHYRCPQCLEVRDEKIVPEFREGLSTKVVGEEAARALSTPDLVCPECDHQWPDVGENLQVIVCPNCDTWMADWLKRNGRKMKRVQDEEFNTFVEKAKANPAHDRYEAMQLEYAPLESEMPTLSSTNAEKSFDWTWLWRTARPYAIGLAAVSAVGPLGWVAYQATRPIDVMMTVDRKRAELPVVIEAYEPSDAEGWFKDMPEDAYSPGDFVSPEAKPAYEIDSIEKERRRVCVEHCESSVNFRLPMVATISPPRRLLAQTYLLASCRALGNGKVACPDDSPAPTPTAPTRSVNPAPAPARRPSPAPSTPAAAPAAPPPDSGTVAPQPQEEESPPPPTPVYETKTWATYVRWDWAADRRFKQAFEGDEPIERRAVDLSARQRVLSGSPSCYIDGDWAVISDDPEEQELGSRENIGIGCDEYAQISAGREYQMRLSRDGRFARLLE